MPKVQIDDQIIELTQEQFVERGYALSDYVDYKPSEVVVESHSAPGEQAAPQPVEEEEPSDAQVADSSSPPSDS
jgi:hypothetical protein